MSSLVSSKEFDSTVVLWWLADDWTLVSLDSLCSSSKRSCIVLYPLRPDTSLADIGLCLACPISSLSESFLFSANFKINNCYGNSKVFSALLQFLYQLMWYSHPTTGKSTQPTWYGRRFWLAVCRDGDGNWDWTKAQHAVSPYHSGIWEEALFGIS